MATSPKIRVSRKGKLWWVKFSKEFVYYDAVEFSTKSSAVTSAKKWARQALREALQEGTPSDWQKRLTQGFSVIVDGASEYFCNLKGRTPVCSRRK